MEQQVKLRSVKLNLKLLENPPRHHFSPCGAPWCNLSYVDKSDDARVQTVVTSCSEGGRTDDDREGFAWNVQLGAKNSPRHIFVQFNPLI